MKNTIILCSPTSEDMRNCFGKHRGYFFPPLGLLFVAQSLQNAGYEVKFYDGNYDPDYKRNMMDYLRNNHERVLFLGFYLALLQIRDFIDIVKDIKSAKSGLPIVIGGPLPSVFPDLAIKSGLVDICCRGDGAKAATDLADSLAGNGRLRDVPNITFLQDNDVISNTGGQRDTLTARNNILYENFIDLESYSDKFNFYLARERIPSIKKAVPILTGLGCSYRCAFCENALLGHTHLSLSAEDIIEQIIYYRNRFNIDSFSFFDEDFFIDKARLFKFLELLNRKDLKIKWGTQGRANYFNEKYLNDKVLRELENSGCVRISMGVESGSPGMLKKIKKGITPEQVILAAKYGKNSSIYFSYSFIINLPEETNSDFRMSFDLIDKLLSMKKNSFISEIHYYFAYPGTPLSIEMEAKLGYKIQDRVSFSRLGDMSLAEYNNLVNPGKKNAYRETILYYYYRLGMPFQFKPRIKMIYHAVFRLIGAIRKKTGFYSFPVEIYLVRRLKSAVNIFRK